MYISKKWQIFIIGRPWKILTEDLGRPFEDPKDLEDYWKTWKKKEGEKVEYRRPKWGSVLNPEEKKLSTEGQNGAPYSTLKRKS